MVAFSSDRDGNREISVMRRDGSAQTMVTVAAFCSRQSITGLAARTQPQWLTNRSSCSGCSAIA